MATMAEDTGCGAPCPGGTIASVSVAPAGIVANCYEEKGSVIISCSLFLWFAQTTRIFNFSRSMVT